MSEVPNASSRTPTREKCVPTITTRRASITTGYRRQRHNYFASIEFIASVRKYTARFDPIKGIGEIGGLDHWRRNCSVVNG